MFADIDFMKLQRKLKDNKQFVVDITVCSNLFTAQITEQKVNGNGELTYEIDESKTLAGLSSKKLAAWIDA